MINYIRSELYRITKMKTIYITVISLMLFGIFINGMIGWVGVLQGPSFPYDTTSFSYSNLIAFPTLFYSMGAGIAGILYEGNSRNGNLKNSIAFGISRTSIFLGKVLVSILICIISLLAILATYCISAELILEQTGIYTLLDIKNEVLAVFLIAVASVISAIFFIDSFEKFTTAFIIWMLVWIIIPTILSYLGLKFDVLKQIADWLPHNFFSGEEVNILFDSKTLIWDKSFGRVKCIISGVSGIVTFLGMGIYVLRKKDI